jgi:hypothetical protein
MFINSAMAGNNNNFNNSNSFNNYDEEMIREIVRKELGKNT